MRLLQTSPKLSLNNIFYLSLLTCYHLARVNSLQFPEYDMSFNASVFMNILFTMSFLFCLVNLYSYFKYHLLCETLPDFPSLLFHYLCFVHMCDLCHTIINILSVYSSTLTTDCELLKVRENVCSFLGAQYFAYHR